MKKYELIILVIIIALNSCKKADSQKTTEQNKEVLTLGEDEIESKQDSVYDPYLVNDSLTSVLYSNLENIARNTKFKRSKEPIKNRHTDNIIDTIVTRKFKKNEITSYHGLNSNWITKAVIRDSYFELNEFIIVGAKEYVIEKSLAKGIHSDTLKIGNLEQTSVFSLIFESEILKSIEYNGYVD